MKKTIVWTLLACAYATALTAADTSVSWLRADLGPLPQREPVRIHLMVVGDHVERAVVEPFGLAGAEAQIKRTGDRLAGTLNIGHDWIRMKRFGMPDPNLKDLDQTGPLSEMFA